MAKTQSIEKVAEKKKPFLSFADAAEAILRQEGKALTHRQLAQKASAENLIETESETPEISMHVSIRSDMKRRDQRGEPQRFAFLGNGLFTLVDFIAGAPTKKTKSAVDQVRESWKEACDELYKKLTGSNQGKNFETMVADLLVAMGYQNVEVIGGKDDQGVDILCEKRDGVIKTKVAIQCKCKSLASKIGPKDVSTLRDNLSTYQCQQGILVTTSELNEVAKAKAKEAGSTLKFDWLSVVKQNTSEDARALATIFSSNKVFMSLTLWTHFRRPLKTERR